MLENRALSTSSPAGTPEACCAPAAPFADAVGAVETGAAMAITVFFHQKFVLTVQAGYKGREKTLPAPSGRMKARPMPTYTPPPKAAALSYDKDKSAAPKMTAKGRGRVAEAIIAAAKEHNIPIHSDADLMEILDKVELDTEIPLEVYAIVAEIFAYVYKTNQTAKERAAP
jgi:flagellar biosynthesis protein